MFVIIMSDTHYHDASTLHYLLKVCQKMAVLKIKMTDVWHYTYNGEINLSQTD